MCVITGGKFAGIYKKLETRLDMLVQTSVCLGFNSSGYDWPLIANEVAAYTAEKSLRLTRFERGTRISSQKISKAGHYHLLCKGKAE